jgi:hypothetical protein
MKGVYIKTIFILAAVLLLPCIVFAAPSVDAVSGALAHGGSVTITGSGFGTKPTPASVVWDNVESGAFSGGWTSSRDLSVSSSVSRHADSTYSGYCNMNVEKHCSFTGGTNGTTWFAQYWFYLGSNFVWVRNGTLSLGNVKIFRLWNSGETSENFWMAWGGYDVIASTETVATYDWNPVIPGTSYVDLVLGNDDPGYVDPGWIGWKHFDSNVTSQVWHLFQFEWKEGTTDGTFRAWLDGKQIINRSNLNTGSTTKRIYDLGFYNSASTGGTNSDFYLDDAYIDNTWARVEIGDAATYATSAHREIQPATAWDNGSLTVTLNRGSFGVSDNAYLYVVDSAGAVNADGYAITFGDNVADTTPAAFSIPDNTGVARSTAIGSDNITVAGIDNETTLALTGTGCEYSINGAAWATAADNVSLNDNVSLRVTSSDAYNTATNCVLTLGGVSDTWSVTTLAAVNDPVAGKTRGSFSGGWR